MKKRKQKFGLSSIFLRLRRMKYYHIVISLLFGVTAIPLILSAYSGMNRIGTMSKAIAFEFLGAVACLLVGLYHIGKESRCELVEYNI